MFNVSGEERKSLKIEGYIIGTGGKLIFPAKTLGIVLIAISGVFIAL